jgi:ABC-type phosphate/phosphonate transport system permease subunit
MDLNIITFTYLFLRLAPFVLVCFFSLSSFLNQDFKGLVYLSGLIFTCFCTMIFGNVLTFIPKYLPEDRPEICNMITVNQQSEISKLPLGQTVFGFTFCYLLYPMIKNNYIKQNIPTLIFFPALIFFDLIWNIQNTCYTLWQLIASLALGSLFGILWAYLISLTYNPSLQYLNKSTNNEVCSKPSKQTFSCKVYKNGEIVSQFKR